MCQGDSLPSLPKLSIDRTRRLLLAAGIAGLLLISSATASGEERVGVVTNVEGPVTVTRATLTEPAPLRFRDSVFIHDRIATGDAAVARMLVGAHAVITVREHSVVTITESPTVSNISVARGRVAVSVLRERMRPGSVVEVRTPNAVAGIRGTVIVAEVRDDSYSAITVLKGVIDVRRLEAGNPIGSAVILNRLERIVIQTDQRRLSQPETVSAEAARSMRDQFRLAPSRQAAAASMTPVIEGEIERFVASMSASDSSISGPPVPAVGGPSSSDGTVSTITADPLAASGPTTSAASPTAATATVVSATTTVAPSTASPIPTTVSAPVAPTPASAASATASARPGVAMGPSTAAASVSPAAKSQSVLDSVVDKALGRDSAKAERSGSNRGRH